jgi:hypothetical protein
LARWRREEKGIEKGHMIQRFVNKLPGVLQTEVNKEFYAATFDQLFNPANVEQAQGFIGRRTSDVLDPEVDNYLGEPNKNRAAYQLEPIAYAVNAALQDSNHVFYEDLLNYVKHHGGNVDNHDRLFSDLYYAFSPPIDVDKFLNYQNYLWLEATETSNTAPIAFIQAPLLSGAEFDLVVESIIGSLTYNTSNNTSLVPQNFELSSGMRVQFEGSASYDEPLYVECVGRGIRLVTDKSVLGFDRLFDELGNRLAPDLSVEDYMTVERGSCEGSSWSRTNRWFHEDAVDTITGLGQLIAGTVTTPGINYEIGDNLTVNIGDGENGSFVVTGLASVAGDISTVAVLNRGTGYSFAQADDSGAVPAVPQPLEWDNATPGGLGSSWDPNNIATNASAWLTELGQTQADFDGVPDNGSFTAGTGHAALDEITLSDGTVVRIDTVVLGVPTHFTITLSSTSLILSQGSTLSQASTTGTGIGFELILDSNNELGVTLWDDNTIVTGAGSGALIDGVLASAVSRSNKASRPILEYKKDIELYDFGNRYIGDVTAVAATENFGDIHGIAAGLQVDGHTLIDGDTIIFLNPVSVPTFLEWDKDPDAGFGTLSGSRWDESTPVTTSDAATLAFADVGAADTITRAGGASDFISEGFTPGQVCNISGSVGNDGDYEILLVTATVITLAATESLSNEGAVGATIRGYNTSAAGTTPWDVSGSAGSLTRFVWRVDTVTNPGIISLDRIDLETGVYPTSEVVEIGEDVLILEGDTYQGDMFYQHNDVFTGEFTWEQAQRKSSANQQPLFTLYDGDGISLDDSVAYPTSTFAGNEIYSYKVLTQERLTEQGGGVLVDDPILGFPLETKGFRELGDVIFENDLESNRVSYIPTAGALTEILGYYFFKVFDTDPADCTINGEAFETNWKSSSTAEELRVIDRFLTATDDEDTFPLSGVPVTTIAGPANYVVTQGRRLNTSEFAYIPETNSMKLLARSTLDQSLVGTGAQAGFTFDMIYENFELYVDGIYQVLGTDLSNEYTDYIIVAQSVAAGTSVTFVTPPALGASILGREQASGAPGAGKVVELLTYTFDPIADEDLGYFEVPNELENNPNNLDVVEQSWNEFTPHYTSIITEQAVYEGTAFGAGNNYRDTLKDGSLGTFILQNQSPLLKTMLCTSSEELDIVESIRLSSNEYTRYKNKFIKVGQQLVKEGFTPQQVGTQIPVSEWVDEAIRRIIRAREYDTSFDDTYMVAWNTVYQETEFTANGASVIYSTTDFVDLEDKRNVMYVYVDEILQAVDRDYTITNYNPIQITTTEIIAGGASVVIRLFGDSAPAHIPATPTKLGLYTASVPAIITDDTYANSTQFILGHDGSKTPIYNTVIDELLLEFETRIYNGIIDTFRNDYTPPLQVDTYKPGKFRETRWSKDEWNDLIKQSFYKWVATNKADYITNGYYDAADSFSWNYETVLDVDGESLPGYWRGIFDHYYDTQTPDSTPWEMLGFKSMPDWWETTALLVGDEAADELALFGDNFTGYGAAPYLPTNSMWSDLEAGIIRRQLDDTTQALTLGYIDTRYIRTDLVSKYIPVDVLGALKASPLLVIDATASLTDPTSTEAQDDYNWTDWAPVEYAWRTSESYPFALMEALFLARPGEFGEKFWDPEHIYEIPVDNEQIVSSEAGLNKRLGNSVLYVHGETVSGVPQIQTGYQVWIAGLLKALKKDVSVDFGDLLRTLDVKLGHKMAAFTDKDTMKVFVEGISVQSQASNLLVPAENIDVVLYTGAPVQDYFYGGVLIRALANDIYQVFGYDITAGEFTYLPRVTSAADQDVTVGGQPESFTNFTTGQTYLIGVIARLNGTFYRCIETHVANSFETDKWLKLNKLPITGGVSASYKPTGATAEDVIPYGHKFNGVQEVFDFLVGLGDSQENAGWTFETVNTANNTINNWTQAAKDFLFWVGTQWEENSLIMLSPMAEKAILDAQEGYPDNVEKRINGTYSILDKNGVAIDPINTVINRNERRLEIEPDIDQTGLYGVRAITRETENIVTFDNVTVFNDILYDPILGSRLARLDFRGRRTLEWTGKLEAAGFIITANGLLPNYENMVDSIRNYHNTEIIIDNPAIEQTARHLIGFDERDYFTDLGILDDAQYQFYQGMIRQKGTRQAVEKMERNKLVTSIDDELTIIEEWALKLDNFGAVCVNNFTEFLIAADEVKVDPQLVQLAYPATEDTPPTYAFDSVADVSVPDNTITVEDHNYRSGAPKLYEIGVGDTVVTGLTADTVYYVIVVDDDTFQLAATKADATAVTPIPIVLTGTGVGTAHTLSAFPSGVVIGIDVVSASNTYVIPPTVFITNHPDDTTGSGATATSVLDTDGTLLRIDLLTSGSGYSHAPNVAIQLPVVTAGSDRAISRIRFDVATDVSSDSVILIDIDDETRWITKPGGVACDVAGEIWPDETLVTYPNTTNAGYVHSEDADFQSFAESDIDSLSTAATIPTKHGQTIWVARDAREEFGVYVLDGYKGSTIVGQLHTDFDSDPDEGTFFGGSGYVVTELITLNDGTVVEVDGETGGVVTDFNISTASTSAFAARAGTTLTAVSSNGLGNNDFTLTVGIANEASGGSLPGTGATLTQTPAVEDDGLVTLTSIPREDLIEAQFTFDVDGETVDGVTVVDGGFGYTRDSEFTITTASHPSGNGDAVIEYQVDAFGSIASANVSSGAPGTEYYVTVDTAVINAGGSNYSINDLLSVVGGTGVAATLTVDEVGTIAAQDETDFDGVSANEGTFAGGTGYAISDVITLSDGSTITVDNATISTIVHQDDSDFDGAGSNGSYVGGTDYLIGDIITMTDGTVVQVTAAGDPFVDPIVGAAISGFQIISATTVSTIFNNEVLTPRQAPPSGGAGFTMTLDTNNAQTTPDTGVVTEFTVTTATTTGITTNVDTLTQGVTTGLGVNFTLTLGTLNQEVYSIAIATRGEYSNDASLPSATAATTVIPSIGTGATVDLTFFDDAIVIVSADIPEPTGWRRYMGNSVRNEGQIYANNVLYDYVHVSGSTYTLSKDGVAIEDETLADNTEYFTLANLRFRSVSERAIFEPTLALIGDESLDVDGTTVNPMLVWTDGETQSIITSGASTLTFADDNPDTITRTAGTGTFVSEGFVAGQLITVTGTVSNNGTYTIATGGVTPTVITLVAGDTLVAEGPIAGTLTGAALDTLWTTSIFEAPSTFTPTRTEAEYIETFKFDNAFVYENDTKDTLAQIPVYDPFKGIIPGTADLNITWKSQRDPARYTNASDTSRLVDADLAFDGDQVGLLWWDQSTSAYLHYEQGTDEYRRDNWGKLFPGSSVDIYEWTRSTSLPSAYTGDGTVYNANNYTELQEWDPILERVTTFYYFWVKDRTEIPGGVNRTIAAFEVAAIINNPASNLYQWFSPVSQTGFMFSGVDSVFTDSDNVFQINFRRSDDERPTHVEWELGRENDPSYTINAEHWDKMVDSLVGYTEPVSIGAMAYTDAIGSFNTDPEGATDSSGVDGAANSITTKEDHGFSTGDGARYSNGGGVDNIGLTDGTMYYVEVLDDDTIYLHLAARQAKPLAGPVNPATRIIITSIPTPVLPLLPEVHTLTVESMELNNFNNALPTAADPEMGYLLVPDPTLSTANQLGIRTRPMQSMFLNLLPARRVYVDKINELVESIILRDENPIWNATLSTNVLWEWVDWYLEGYDATNTSPVRQVDDTSDLASLPNPIDGDIVKVIGTRFSLYEYSDDTGLYTLVMREASRLNLLDTIYTAEPTLETALELRELILAIQTEVFVDDLAVNNNLVFFAMLNYVFSEQDDLDWAFKSTYIFLDQTGQTLGQPRVFQEDPFDSALEYITEAKPYQTKIRDFRVTRATEIDLLEGVATEQTRRTSVFMNYDQIRGGDLSVTEMRIAKYEGGQSASYDGYSDLDSGTTLVRLGAAGRAVNNYRTELADIQGPQGDPTLLASFDPAQSGFATTTDELEAVSAINASITTEFFFDFQGSFLQNTSFGGLPTLGSFTINPTGGTGYIVGEILSLAAGSGTPVSNAQFRVSAIGGSGEITALDLIDGGSYIQTPTVDPVDLLGGSGTGGQLTALIFENGSSVPHDTTPWDQIGFESSVNDPNVTTLDGSPDNLTTTVPGSTQANYDGVFPNGSFAGGTGYKANTGSNDYTSGLTFAFVGGADTITRTDGTAFDTAGEFTVGQKLVVTAAEDGANNGTYTIAGVTATVITLSTSDVLTNTAAPPDTTAQLAGFDTIIMQDGPNNNNGSNITVDVVAAGIVTGFTITGGSTAFIVAGDPILQASSNDAGTGFVLTTGTANTTEGTFANIPAEETFSGTGTTKEFAITTTVPTFFMFVVVDGIEQVLNIDYFFVGSTLTFVSIVDSTGFRDFGAPSAGTDNIQLFTYIEAGDLINPQVTAGITEEMVPLDPRENLIVIADSTDVALTVAGTGYGVGETLTATGGVRLQSLIAAQDETDFDGIGSNGTFVGGDGATVFRPAAGGGQSLAFDGSGTSDTITRTGGTAFDTLGFASGQTLTITGSENSGENDGKYTIATVTATVITLTAGLKTLRTNVEDTTAELTAGDAAYVVGDVITLTDQSTITVDAIDVNGDVTDFTVTTASGIGFQPATILSQESIVLVQPDPDNLRYPANAKGFSITPDTNNEDDFGSALTIEVVTTSAGPPGPIATFTVTNQGDYFVYPTSPFATVTDGTGDDAATFTLTSLSYRIHNDTAQNLSIVRNADSASTTLTATIGLTDNLIPVTSESALYSTTPTRSAPQIAWIGTERIIYHGVNAGSNELTGVIRGTNGTHAQTHQVGAKVFDGGEDQVIPSPNVYWVDSATTSYQAGAATAGTWIYNGNGNVHFADLVDTTMVTNGGDPIVVGDTLRVTVATGFTQTQNSYFIKDLIATGEVSILTVDVPGTGYSVGDVLSVAEIEGALGVPTTPAVLEVGGVFGNGSIAFVYIRDRGTGYGAGGTAYTLTGSGDGNAQISLTTAVEGVVLAQPAPIIFEDGRITELVGLTWVVDRALPGGLNAATTTAAVFIQSEEGNVLPISLSP